MIYRKDQKDNRGFLNKVVDKYLSSKSKTSKIVRTGAYLAAAGIGFLFGGEYVQAGEPRAPARETKLSLETKALQSLKKSNQSQTLFERIKLREQTLLLYNKAENLNTKTKEYELITKGLKQELANDYSKLLMTATDKGVFHDGFIKAKRLLGKQGAKDLEEKLRFSDMLKKRGMKKIKNQFSVEATSGRNKDSISTYERTRISAQLDNPELGDFATKIIQQHHEQRMITDDNEEEVSQDQIGHIDLSSNVWKTRINIISSGGKEKTTTKSHGYGHPIDSIHRIDSDSEYKFRVMREFGGILASIDLGELLPVELIAGADYTQTETYSKTTTINDVINLEDPNGSYQEETTGKFKTHVKEHLAFGGIKKRFRGGDFTVLTGHKKVSERHGLGDNRTVRYNEETWASLQLTLMLGKHFGISGMIANGVMKDELLQPGTTDRSRENDVFTEPRFGVAAAVTIPDADITAFFRYGHTEGVDSGSAGLILTTGKNQGRVPKLLEMLTQENSREMGLSPGQTSSVSDLLNDNNKLLLMSMLETGNRYGFGTVLNFDIETVPGNIPTWAALAAVAVETPRGTFALEYRISRGYQGGVNELKIVYGDPKKRFTFKLIGRQKTDKRNKDLHNEVGGEFSWSF